MTRRERAHGPISWMARNPVAANLLMVGLMLGGLVTSFNIRQEVFPQFELDRINIAVPYPGASPAEVEQGILLVIEEQVRSIEGIKEVRATALEGSGTVRIELETGIDRNKALADVKNAVDRIITFPEDAERPIVNLVERRRGTLSIALYGDQSELLLRQMAEQIRDEMLEIEEVTIVELSGTRPLEVAVEIPKDRLRSLGLTLGAVASTIRRTALELPAGGVKTKGGEVLLRTAERRDLGSEFADVPVVVGEDGNYVLLGDIASIEDSFRESDAKSNFNGKPAIFFNVFAVGDQSPTEVAAAAKRYIVDLEQRLPEGLSIGLWSDRSEIYAGRLDLLLRNGMIGLALVLTILGLFLEPRLAFWVTMGIPVSFLGSFLILPSVGISLNVISLFAFIVTLGMVVDDAIIVGENAFRLRREGVPPLRAAIEGAREVSVPVFFSIATTIAAFTPLLFIPGTRGKFLHSIPVVVISVLLISLIESFFILPAHVSHVKSNPFWERLFAIPQRFSRGVERFIERIYDPLLSSTLRQRWTTIGIGIAIFIICFGVLKGGHVKFIDFPREESDWIWVSAKLPFGAPAHRTEAVAERMLTAAREVTAEYGGERITRGIYSMTGSGGSHTIEIGLVLVPVSEREIGSHRLAEKWRDAIGEITGLESIKFDSSTGHGEMPPIDLQLSHRDPKVLENAARSLAAALSSFEGVTDINDGVELGKTQIDFKLSPAGIATGLSVSQLASQVRHSFYGAEALRQQRGRNEVRVIVRLPRAERESLTDIDNFVVQTPSGGEIPLNQAAHVDHGRSYTQITRTDGRRTLRVQAEVIEGKANAHEVMTATLSEIVPDLKSRFPGLSVGRAGRQKSMQEFWDYLRIAFSFALLAIYALIAIPLKSYLQPLFVVMMAIPFGFVGALLGHVILGLDWSMISWMGLVALAGVVVNDSLVLVNAANRFRAQGMSSYEAARAASKRRFRPIVLTSLTTFGGLAPMIFETSVQARIMIPMAVSLGFGVLFATGIILLIVPSLFVIIENFRSFLGTEATTESTEVTPNEPA